MLFASEEADMYFDEAETLGATEKIEAETAIYEC